MILQDPKKLAKLMAIQGISQRQLARAVGWESHTFLGRLLKGEVKSLKPEQAVRIATCLGVGTDDLFLARMVSNTVRSGQASRATVRKKVAA